MSSMERALRGKRSLFIGRHNVGILLFLGLLLPLVACGSENQASNASNGKVLSVVAGENFWGSIATQIGGKHVSVKSLVSSPSGDPHDYESTNDDARAIAQADYVILNGAGYDAWGNKLLDANPSDTRKLLDVGKLVGKKEGDNPHLWYNPTYVQQAARQITADYKAIDSADASYFDQQYSAFEVALKPYLDKITEMKSKYTGVPIGISESIFMYMTDALGLKVITPEAYYTAEANGSEPPASTIAEFNDQVTKKEMKVFILNVQTIDNSVKNLQQQVAKASIPVVEVSETVRPTNGKFQDWQLAQLDKLEQALSQSHNS
ncbi:ABC transporter substrate-binding protein [Ktedonobacter sp. SOSP1-85]|uniref:metal ABC transporter solute-binding protein, Zn/Mn family n=1 Tax=Ktedonobacter sp. SOSP1-85 TaxID=2778367 RepID=UPI0019150FA0|nr:zinc ABC transporter substrate-binding protein [Ktedonobacter sp. SOSP1-85]GHO72487.1 ABC transporter substrate-binding protein [Ktedonobacter sp. SOSP1-85]